jgi:predicted CoA-binding protein
MSDIETLRRILATHQVIAVVGLSAEWHRPSFFAAKYMKEHGYRIIPINPKYSTILDETSYPSLESLPPEVAASVGIVDCFRRTQDIMPLAESAVAIGAKVLWQQIGVTNLQADAYARRHGLDSVMDRCVKIEHARLFGGLNWAGVNTGIISSRRPRFLP